MLAVLACIIGWAVHLYGVNQALGRHAIRYRILQIELGYTQPNIVSLNSLLSSEDFSDSICKLRSRVKNYELVVERQAELHFHSNASPKSKKSSLNSSSSNKKSPNSILENAVRRNRFNQS